MNRACLHFEIADDLSSHALAIITRTYSAKLRDGHKDLCGWRDSPCPTEFGTFPVQSSVQLVNAHKQRAASLADLPCLPPLNAERVRFEIYAAASSSGWREDHCARIESTALTNTCALCSCLRCGRLDAVARVRARRGGEPGRLLAHTPPEGNDCAHFGGVRVASVSRQRRPKSPRRISFECATLRALSPHVRLLELHAGKRCD